MVRPSPSPPPPCRTRFVSCCTSREDRSREARLPSDAEAAQHDRALEVSNRDGPALVAAAKVGSFDTAVWTAAIKEADARDFDQTLAALAAQTNAYAALIADMSDSDFRAEVTIFGQKSTRGSFLVNQVLSGCAAYRTQPFLYLKACGREELTTMNLWAGVDAPAAV